MFGGATQSGTIGYPSGECKPCSSARASDETERPATRTSERARPAPRHKDRALAKTAAAGSRADDRAMKMRISSLSLLALLLAATSCGGAGVHVDRLLPAAASSALPLARAEHAAASPLSTDALKARPDKPLLPGGLGRALRGAVRSQQHVGSSGQTGRSELGPAGRSLLSPHSDVALVNDIAGHFEVLAGVMVVLHQLGVTPEVYFAGACEFTVLTDL